jgi:hypothetical protein
VEARPSPEQARRDLVAWFGGMQEIGAVLRERMRPRAAEILGREPADEELQRWAHETRLVVLRKWPEAPEGTTPEMHLEQMVERWADELRQQVRLNCWDVLFIPIFAFGIPAAILASFLPSWAAIAGGLAAAVPIMKWWIWARRTGRVALGDD